MTERFNIIIASENGDIKTFLISRKGLLVSIIVSVLAITALSFSCFFTTSFSIRNAYLSHKMAVIQHEMDKTNAINAGFEARLASKQDNYNNKIVLLKARNEQLVTNLQLKSSHLIADLKLQNLKQRAAFTEEKEQLMSEAVNELEERSELIANIMNTIGIKLKKKKHPSVAKNSGGPFIAIEDNRFNQLLYKADRYMEMIRTVPLGQPSPGPINSPYGPRIDPISRTAAFHPGIDIEGSRGDRVRATADGKVIFAGWHSGYGNFVQIDHGNDYTSAYGHLSRYMVKKGDHVSRGQVIGLIGNTGRSTGSHLHYEIMYRNHTINPYKFLKVVDISQSFASKVKLER